MSGVIHVHAVVYVTGLLLFIMQVVFAASGLIRLHVRLGPGMMAYGLVVIVAGLLAASEGFTARLATGDLVQAQDATDANVRIGRVSETR